MIANDTRGAGLQTLDAFEWNSRERNAPDEPFATESERMLRIDVDGGVWLKPGVAVAYRGALTFDRRPTLGARSAADAIVRETAPVVRARGQGRLYCGFHGEVVRIVRLSGDSVVVAWRDLLAFEESLHVEWALAGHGVGLAAGGLVTATLSGHGAMAIVTQGPPLTMMVSPDRPVSTDPHATVAWSPSLVPALKTDLSWRSAFGHGGQQPFQMFFSGTGFVVVQPGRDASNFTFTPNPVKRAASLIKP